MRNKARPILLALVISILAVLLSPLSALALDPTIQTDPATDITESSVTLNGQILGFGTYGGTYVYLSFDYATDDYYTTHGSTYDRHTSEISWLVADGITTYSQTISSLNSGTDYHFRARIRFTTTYAYGLDDTFTITMVAPDYDPEIILVKAYQDLVEVDDCLFVILVDIPYNTIPAISIDRSFKWSLMESVFGGELELGFNTGYAMNDNGYNLNLYSLYFPASANIDWGNTTTYYLRLSGYPDVFNTTTIYDYTLLSDPWVVSVDYEVTLTKDILTVARTLEQDWQIILLDEQDRLTVLSSNGEKLFRNAIPGIQSMAPSLFFFQSVDTDTTLRTWGTTQSDSYKARLLGPDGQPGGGDDNWIAASLGGVADWVNIPYMLLIYGICAVICVYVIYRSNYNFGTATPGYIASIMVIICCSLLAMGLVVLALIGLILVIATGWVLFMRKA